MRGLRVPMAQFEFAIDLFSALSLAPLMKGSGRSPYPAVFSYYKDFQRTVRTRTHKLIVYPQIKRIQVFDIEHDPREMHDLSADPASAGIKKDLMPQPIGLQTESGDKLKLDPDLIRQA